MHLALSCLLFVHPTWKSFSICGNYNFTYFAYSTSFHRISITTGSLQLEVLVISPFPPLLHLSFLHSIELLALTNSTQKLMLDRKRWANSLILQHSPSRVSSPRPQTWKLEVGCCTLLQKQPFVPVPLGHLSRFWNRDSPSGTKGWRLLSRVAEPGQNVPHAKKNFAPRGIRSQDLLSSAWFSCQLT